MNCPHCDRPLDEAAATITRLVTERDEAREGLDRLEAAYGSLSDDVFSARPKIAAMAKELSEAKAQRDRVVERLSPRMASIVADVAAAHGVPLAEMMSRSRCRQDVEQGREAPVERGPQGLVMEGRREFRQGQRQRERDLRQVLQGTQAAGDRAQ